MKPSHKLDWNYISAKDDEGKTQLEIMYFSSSNRTQITIWNAKKDNIKHVYYVDGRLDRVIS